MSPERWWCDNLGWIPISVLTFASADVLSFFLFLVPFHILMGRGKDRSLGILLRYFRR